MKKIISLLLVGLLSCTLLGCGAKKDTATSGKTETNIEKLDEDSSSDDKETIKKEITEALSDKNVTALDILTLKDGKFKASVQLKGEVLKEDANKEDAIEVCKAIGEKIKPICSEYDIQLIDKNSQVIILFDQDGKTN